MTSVQPTRTQTDLLNFVFFPRDRSNIPLIFPSRKHICTQSARRPVLSPDSVASCRTQPCAKTHFSVITLSIFIRSHLLLLFFPPSYITSPQILSPTLTVPVYIAVLSFLSSLPTPLADVLCISTPTMLRSSLQTGNDDDVETVKKKGKRKTTIRGREKVPRRSLTEQQERGNRFGRLRESCEEVIDRKSEWGGKKKRSLFETEARRE